MLDYVIQYSGLNFAKFYNLIVNQSISIKNIIKLDYKTIKFSVDYNGYKKLILSDCFKNYNISIIKNGGLSLVKDKLISKIGSFIGLIITIIL
ncbi:MAG: sporulation protein YqfD, partial [Clostridia bacterium]|nr:sporulation protein YqfD [Clostridia bacterium]